MDSTFMYGNPINIIDMKTKVWPLLSVLALSFGLISCGGAGEQEPVESEPATQEESTPEETSTVPDVVEVNITGNDQMKYDLDKIEVYEGQTVKLTFTNIGELPVDAMGHNWTLLANGVDPLEYGTAVISFKDNGYQHPDRTDDVIVHTNILGPGESQTIEFEAPSKGIYKFVCTFPGHAALMNGTFLVKGN